MHKLLAVFAHPDDETFICGGTLAKVAKAGTQVVLICATKGEMGRRMGVPPTATRESIAATRERELQSACKALGIKHLHFLGFRDKTLEIQPVETVTNLLLQYLVDERPDAVVTFHERWGGHPDHCAIGVATTRAYAEYSKLVQGTKLYHVCSGHMIRNPEQCGLAGKLLEIDVTDCLQEKLGAFRAHLTQSQMEDWLWEDDEVSASKLWSVEYLAAAVPGGGEQPIDL
ncbi:PIG-L family deacetylase [Alicyclobacillus fastidiosus]|uniref:PIG-L family deacetylase n=1 Tax=Alicyclobacillus fastidiosus TaxID=392011 RepID=A0ABY6ZAQ6_9BACL|nr:PIG-L family deacetylase [Alicyclobacillus fastidiosus]WAH39917.1 PIG-L family deacetylase [Alicyclobacillus fastidiosus]GMA61193.1 bacillithiol biosynthesis deacetylase BshB2 [Alicyclobacillus fastidiosus]